MLKQCWACLGYLCAPITETPFAELVRLSRTSIADECSANDLRPTRAAGSGEAAFLEQCGRLKIVLARR
jgi:hypothetical protein